MTNPEQPAPGPSDPVEGLVFEILERMEREGSAAIDQAASDHPEHAAELLARMRTLQAMGLVEVPPGAPLHIPTHLDGYQLGDPLGEGGMGLVLAAHDVHLDRPVAIKWMRPNFATRPSVLERFLREGQAVARLHHPNIARVFHVGQAEGLPYLVMERIDGCTLAAALDSAQRRFGERPVSQRNGHDWYACVSENCLPGEPSPPGSLFDGSWAQVAARIARAVAEGLQHAHAAGVLHRDVKASNVLLTPSGRVVLIDFGLARLDSAETMTAEGSRLGSLPYTSPECIQAGVGASERSDVYSLGVLLFEMLTQRLPYRAGSEAGLVRLIERGQAPALQRIDPALPRPLTESAERALRRDPTRRTPSAAALAHDLTRALAGQAPIPHGDGALAWIRSHWRGHPVRTVAIAGVAPVLLALPTVLLTLRAQATERIASWAERSQDRLALALEATASLRAALPDAPALEGTSLGRLRTQVLEDLRVVEERIAAERGSLTPSAAVLALERTEPDPLLLEQQSIEAARAWLATPEPRDPHEAQQHLDVLSRLRLASSRSVDAECASIELLAWLCADAARQEAWESAQAWNEQALHRTRALRSALPDSAWLQAREQEYLAIQQERPR